MKVLKQFIVLEGLDGAGTTTQMNLLEKKLNAHNKAVWKTFEPTDKETGKIIRRVLRKEFTLEAETTAGLYAADRYEHIYGKEGIVEHQKQGDIIVCDRYLFSSLAYQTPLCGFDFVWNLNKEYPLPEHLFFIEVPVNTCQKRMKSRGGEVELFDAEEYQIKVYEAYLKALDMYKETSMKVHRIDGSVSPEEISERIWKILEDTTLKTENNKPIISAT